MPETTRSTRRRWLASCAGAAGLSALAGCSDDTAVGGDDGDGDGDDDGPLDGDDDDGSERLPGWPMYGADPMTTGYHPSTSGPSGDVGEAWRFEYDASKIRAPPVFVDGTVYVGVSDGATFAIDAEDGSVLWDAETDRVDNAPLVLDDAVYVQASTELYALERDTGEVRWVEDHRGTPHQPIAYDGAALALMTHGAESWVYRYDPSDGSKEALYEFPNSTIQVTEQVALAGDTLFLGRWEDIVAVDVAAGEELWTWSHPDDYQLKDGLCTDGDAVYAAANHLEENVSACVALDATDGGHRWTTDIDESLRTPPSVDGDAVYVPGYSIRALGVEDGETLWEDDQAIHSKPTVADGTVYGQDGDGHVAVAFDAESGDVLWTFDVPAGRSEVTHTVVLDGLALAIETHTPAIVAIEDV